MAGRNDFGIIRSEVLTDRRVHKAADLLVSRGLATEATAFATVCGYIGLLGVWAMRETDDGVLPDDGVWAIHLATVTPRAQAAQIVEVFRDADLLREQGAGQYLVGFDAAYQAIVDRRTADREAKALKRAEEAEARRLRAEKIAAAKAASAVQDGARNGRPQDVRTTSAGHPKDVASTSARRRGVPERAVRAVPAVPSGTERNGTAGTAGTAGQRPRESHPSSAGGSALASGADAEPPAATRGTAKPLTSPSGETLEQARARGLAALAKAGKPPEPPPAKPTRPPAPGLTDDERRMIRLAGCLAGLPPDDPRREAADQLLAERPRTGGWNDRAAELLGGGDP